MSEVIVRGQIISDVIEMVRPEVQAMRMGYLLWDKSVITGEFTRDQKIKALKVMIWGHLQRRGIEHLEDDEKARIRIWVEMAVYGGISDDTPESRQTWLETSVRREEIYPSLPVEMGADTKKRHNLFGIELWSRNEGYWGGPKGRIIGSLYKLFYIPGTYRNIENALNDGMGVGIVLERTFNSMKGKVITEYFMEDRLGEWEAPLSMPTLIRVLSVIL